MADPPENDSGAAPEGSGAAPAGPSIEELSRQYGGPLVRWLRVVHTPLHVAAGLTMLALMSWTVIDIIGRWLFNSPLRGSVELTELAVVIVIYLGLSYAESRDSHITVDLLYVRLGIAAKLALRVFAGLLSFAVIVAMTWRLWVFAGQLEAGSYTTGILRIPLFPVAWLAVLGAAMFGLAVLTNTAVCLLALVRRRPHA